MFTDHPGRDGQDGIRVVAFGGLFSERVQEQQPRLVVLQPALGRDPCGGFHHDGDDAGRLAVLTDHRRIIEIHEDLLGPAGAMQGQFLVLVGQRTAGEADLHDVIVEISDLGPAFPHLAAEQFRMPSARHHGIGIVVDHDAVLAPKQHDGNGGMNQDADGCLEALRPMLDRTQRSRPVMRSDQGRRFAAPQKRGRAAACVLRHCYQPTPASAPY
jgi:hypothetical protein